MAFNKKEEFDTCPESKERKKKIEANCVYGEKSIQPIRNHCRNEASSKLGAIKVIARIKIYSIISSHALYTLILLFYIAMRCTCTLLCSIAIDDRTDFVLLQQSKDRST